MSSTNNIWIVSNSMSGGGAERASNLLANLLFDQSLAVVQIHLNKSPIDLVRNRCPVICLERDKNGNIISLFKLAIKFGFLSRKFPISYMILNCELPELVSLFSSRRIRKIVVEHADPSWVGRRALGILVRKLLFKLHRADFVAVSTHIKVFGIGDKHIQVIPNLIELPKIKALDPSPLARIVYIGRLDKEIKRSHLILEIGKLLKVPILFIGDGPMTLDLQKIDPQEVQFVQLPWREEPWKEIREGDLLCIPSKTEGDGLVAIEAIASGVPLILSDIKAFRRFRLPDHHYFKDAKEARANVDNLQQDLTNFRVPQSSRIQILESRDSAQILNKWLTVLRLGNER